MHIQCLKVINIKEIESIKLEILGVDFNGKECMDKTSQYGHNN